MADFKTESLAGEMIDLGYRLEQIGAKLQQAGEEVLDRIATYRAVFAGLDERLKGTE